MNAWVWRYRSVRAALGLAAVSAVTFGWSVWRAVRLDGATSRPLDLGAVYALDATAPAAAASSLDQVLAAVAKDPFHPERRRPALRFRLPGETGAGLVVAAAPDVRVLGTAVGADGGFAMCAWAGGAPQIVHVGQRVGGGDWTLKRVTPGAAEFVTPTGRTVVVRIPKAGGGT